MGIPSPDVVQAPAAGDEANAVVEGVLNAAWSSSGLALLQGNFNVSLCPVIVTDMTTTDGSLTAAVASVAGMTVGDPVQASTIPAGAYLGAVGGTTTITLAGISAAEVSAGVVSTTFFGDSAANFKARVERSFDGGSGWFARSAALTGTKMEFDFSSAGLQAGVSFILGEPESGVLTRVVVVAYTAGKLQYRLSQTGGMARSSIPYAGGP